MSYPSIVSRLQLAGVLDLEEASENQLKTALLGALQTDLKLGMDYLRGLAADVKAAGKRVLKIEDPNSALGKQLIRLLGTDIARPICEDYFGVAFGFYNCCSVVAAPNRDGLALSIREQIMLQNGVLAHADC